MSEFSEQNALLHDVIVTDVRTSGELSRVVREVGAARVVALTGELAEAKGARGRLSSLGILLPPRRLYVLSGAAGSDEGADQRVRLLGELLQKRNLHKVGHGLKNLVKAFPGALEPPTGNLFDTAIAAALLWEPSRLDSLAEKRLGVTIPDSSSPTLFGTDQSVENLALKTVCIYRLYKLLSRELERKGMGHVAKLEMEVIPLPAEMEATGLLVDRERLGNAQRELDAEMSALKDKIVEVAGSDFNPNSPKQVAEILFDRLRLAEVSGRSTRGWILKKLGDQHPFPKLLLGYRELAKLRNAYVAPLLRKTDPETGRVHPTFWQIVGSGRMSSDMHQIPRSGGIRECFVAPPGWLLLSADYSQIELRVIAAFSRDEELLRSFRKEEDIHRRTASEVFTVELEEVTEEQRQAAKAINFGLCYGMSARGLAAALSIPLSQASEYMSRFFQTYKGVRFYMTEVVKRARRRGYVKTLFGRRIPVRGINDASASRRSGAEKAAINAPIQGTAGGDLIKLAMLRVRDGLYGSGLPAKIILQMHDELLLEVKKEAVREVARLVKEKMEAPVERLNVPLRVDISTGSSWGEMAPVRL